METKVYDIVYKFKGYSPDSEAAIAVDRVKATAVYINDFGQLIVADNLRQVRAFAKDIWINFKEVPNENS
jgi:hypothetical protein